MEGARGNALTSVDNVDAERTQRIVVRCRLLPGVPIPIPLHRCSYGAGRSTVLAESATSKEPPCDQPALTHRPYALSSENCAHALLAIDADGVIAGTYVSPIGVNPGADGILNALDALQQKAAS